MVDNDKKQKSMDKAKIERKNKKNSSEVSNKDGITNQDILVTKPRKANEQAKSGYAEEARTW